MKTKKKVVSSPYWVHCRFRMSDEDVGLAQHYMVDDGWSVARTAAKFGVSEATMYRIRAAVPASLITVRKPRLRRAS